MIDEVEEIDVDTTTDIPNSSQETPINGGGNSGGDGGDGGDGDGGDGDGGDGDGGDGNGGDKGDEEDGGDKKDGGDGDGGDKGDEGDDGDKGDEGDDGDEVDEGDKGDKKDEGDEGDEGSSEPEEVFNSLAIEIANDVKKSFSDKGYANAIEQKGGTFMYLWEILFGASFKDLFIELNTVNGMTKIEIEDSWSDSYSYDELLEFDREVSKKMIRKMRDYPNYFDVENAWGHLMYDTLKNIGAMNYHNFFYQIERGSNFEVVHTYFDVDYILINFINTESNSTTYSINKTAILKFDTKNKLTNFVSLYSNNEELNILWIILHQLAIELLPYRANEQEWVKNIGYPEFGNANAYKFIQQLRTLQNAII